MARYKAIHEFTVIYKTDYPTLNKTVNVQKYIDFFI